MKFKWTTPLFGLVFNLSATTWNPIQLPNEYIVPPNLNRNVYSTALPSEPLQWEKTSECHTFQPTSIHWKSDYISNVKGLSFKGLVFKLPELKDQGSSLNSFAVFYHDHDCYVDGSEYGWSFSENMLPKAKFYLCHECNIWGSQKWINWPGDGIEVLEGDAKLFEEALEDSGIYRYWEIIVTKNGDFTLNLINPSNYQKLSITLKKPSWYPNLYNLGGYITITSKKQAETTLVPPPFMHVDTVKVFQ